MPYQVCHDKTLAILCGGLSSRLGTDKGLYKPLGDESLVGRALRLWSEQFREVLIVVRDCEQKHIYEEALTREGALSCRGSKVRIVTDSVWQRAVMAGVFTALSHARTSHVIAVPVDQLGVRGRDLERLAALNDPGALRDGSDLFPFPSIWPTAAKDRVSAALETGGLNVRRLLSSMNAVMLEPDDASILRVNGNTKSDITAHFGERPLFDRFGRRMHYLRFSLTEACNMSCRYCLPEGFPEWYRHKARLAAEDVVTLLKGFRRLGFRKVRFTGGEPTVHPFAKEAVAEARRLGFERIAITTNGGLIKDFSEWVSSGLDQINISLDSLRPDTFAQITKSRDHSRVMDIVKAALASGIEVKINTVLMRSVNFPEVEELIDWALSQRLTLRFIELMPTGLNQDFYRREQVLNGEIIPLLTARGLTEQKGGTGPRLDGPATQYASVDLPGKIGLINPLSCNFCAACNRLRVTARGEIKLCLFGDENFPLNLANPASVEEDVRRLIGIKGERHHLERGDFGNVATFRTIGG